VEALGLIGRDAQAAAPVIARWANDNRHNRDRMRLAEQALERIGPISSEAYQVGREPTATGQPGSPPGPGRPPPAQGPQREKPPPPKKESDPISRPG
jgi:hypothetical protein